MRCGECGTELIAGKPFCHACGARAAQECGHCGATVPAGYQFCPDCGSRLDSPTPAADSGGRQTAPPQVPDELAQRIRASREAIEGERKVVTVLFCDLAGSTALAERLDPEEYHDLLDQYLELSFREIYRFDGIVNQLAGDGFMALFGAPVAHEDAPQRALRAALQVQAALAAFNVELLAGQGIELRARIGIHTGPVVVGKVGNDLKMDYSAIGDTTNLAARLEALAEPGTILMSDATARLVRGLFQVRPAGPFTVKGKTEPVQAHVVLGLGDATAPIEVAAKRGLTPFVGRDAELAQMQACYDRLSEEFAQVVAVVGDAGSGKSRLVYEFRHRLAARGSVVFEARCSPWDQQVPYAPFTAMLRQYFDLGPQEPAARSCEKISRRLDALGAGLDAAFPYLCHILSLPCSQLGEVAPEDLKRKTFEAVGMLVMAEGERAPAVMVIEDLQWLDEPSREMLDAAVATLASKPLMLLVTHRPDFDREWRTSAGFTRLHLRRLGDDAVTRIACAAAGGALPADLLPVVIARSEGNPFLAEEVTRALLEEGIVDRGAEGLRLTRPVEEIRIPGTVQEVVAARLDRLGAEAKRVAQVAAVLGRQFHREQLSALLAGEGIDVGRQLDDLERRGMIHRLDAFSRDEYRFGESATQEVAYEGMLLRQRRQLHERVAELVAAGPGEATPERTALLAHHFSRSDNRERTAAAFLQAARGAETVPSYGTAARMYRQAWEAAQPLLAAAPGGPAAAMAVDAAIGMVRMALLYNVPVSDDLEEILVRARAIAEARGDTANSGGLMAFAGLLTMNLSREGFAPGLAMVEEGLAAVQRSGSRETALAISRGLAWAYLLDGQFALARRTIDWVVAEFEQLPAEVRPSDLYLGSHFLRNRILYHADEYDECLTATRRTYEMGVRASNRTVQGGSAATIAQVMFATARYAEAKEWAARAIDMAAALGHLPALRAHVAVGVLARVELGETLAGSRDIEALSVNTGASIDFIFGAHFVVDALVAVGHRGRAEDFARGVCARATGRLREMIAALALAQALAGNDPALWPEAQRRFEESARIAAGLGARSVLAAAHTGAGVLAVEQGDVSAGRAHLHQALAAAGEIGLRHYERRAAAALREADDAGRKAGYGNHGMTAGAGAA